MEQGVLRTPACHVASSPRSTVLFALHPERGTLSTAAYLSIDMGLRAAALAELKLTGHIQARSNGQVRVNPALQQSPHHPALRDVLDLLRREMPQATVRQWYELLEAHLPDLKDPVAAVLRRRGIVAAVGRSRAPLPERPTFPTIDPSAREDQILLLKAAVDDGDDIQPRYGMLVGLVSVCRLVPVVFGERAAAVEARAQWVFERDVILAMAAAMVEASEQV